MLGSSSSRSVLRRSILVGEEIYPVDLTLTANLAYTVPDGKGGEIHVNVCFSRFSMRDD